MTHHHHNNSHHPAHMHGMPTGMPNIDYTKDKSIKPRSLFASISIILFLLALVASGYVGWKKKWIESRMVKTQDGLKNIEQKIDKLLEEDKVLLKYKADKIIAQVEPTRIIWSQVFDDITKLESIYIKFENFSVTTNNKVSVSCLGKNWERISSFIGELKENKQVKSPFVASISAQEEEEGNMMDDNSEDWIKFSLVFNYIPKSPVKIESQVSSDTIKH